jgi:GntR family transcriptional regulator / MocR family aminotransferase
MLANHLSESRSLHVQPGQIMITRGTQMAIYLAAAVLLNSGDRVVVGDPGYVTATRTFEQCGARITRIPVDDQGFFKNAIDTFGIL